ncbi:hypothetical protein ID866_5839 [Astraeus odoratus]|nr:hypothetical protein ID866_5839 [Astraeus odoratus]
MMDDKGSMPTDGTLLLEHVPQNKQYLVTALSIFFSVGSVVAAFVGLLTVPKYSCSPNQPCDPSTDNVGWQYMLAVLGLITLSMFLARILFFRLHESPRYLVHAGRHQEALENLQLISRFNGSEISLELEDVDDRRPPEPPPDANGVTGSDERAPFLLSTGVPEPSSNQPVTTLFDANADGGVAAAGNGVTHLELVGEEGMKCYQSTDESPNALDSHSFVTPIEAAPPRGQSFARGDTDSTDGTVDMEPKRRPSFPRRRHPTRQHSRSSSSIMVKDIERRFGGMFASWMDRIRLVLRPEWFRTTTLVWAIWFCIALAYTIFNVYFPKLLETGSSGGDTLRSLEDNLWDVVIFTLGGCPGAILGAYLVESTLGRRGSLAGTTALTALCCSLFVHVKDPLWIRLSSLGISLCSTTMYAILYGWTPEIFGTEVRGTACGTASALSRIGGMIAPLLGGALMMINRALPVYTSIVVYVIAVVCVLLLRETAGHRGERSFTH